RHASHTLFEDPSGMGDGVAEDARLVLVHEHVVRCEIEDDAADLRDSGIPQRAPGREVDADRCPGAARELDCTDGGRASGVSEEGVPGNEEVVDVGQPGGVDLVGSKLRGSSAIGCHRALAVGGYDRADDAVPALCGTEDLDTTSLELAGDEASGEVVASLADESRLRTESRRPRGDVRRLPSRR